LQVKAGADDGGERRALLTTGAALTSAMEWSQHTALQGVGVYSLPLWGMKTKTEQAAQASSFRQISTIEDHLRDGGFGSWLREALADDESFAGQLRTHGLDSAVCGMVAARPP